jgi:hypothetical protein
VQVGDKKKAYQDQSSGPDQSAGNIAYINQSGMISMENKTKWEFK